MVFERVDGIVGGADSLHVVAAHESACGHRGIVEELVVTFIKDFTGGLGVEKLVDAESCLEFEVSPVVEGVPEGVGNGFGPLLEFFPVRGVSSGAEAFVYAV